MEVKEGRRDSLWVNGYCIDKENLRYPHIALYILKMNQNKDTYTVNKTLEYIF